MMFEASARVPLIVAGMQRTTCLRTLHQHHLGPGITPNSCVTRVTQLLDLYPTVVELTQTELPSGHTLDGWFLSPRLPLFLSSLYFTIKLTLIEQRMVVSS